MTRTIEAHPTPGLLRWARESAGLSFDEVARENRIEAIDLQAWEDGLRNPPVSRLRDLADAYKRPLGVFYLPFTPAPERQPTDFRSVRGESAGGMPSELRFAIRQARLIASIVKDVEPASARRVELPRATTSSSPAAIASQLRTLLGVTPTEQRDWQDAEHAFSEWRWRVEALGIVTLQLPFTTLAARGFSLRPDGWRVIVVSARDAKPAKCFTLMHELAHLCMGEDGICKIVSPFAKAATPQAMIELFCNRVAGHVLAPSDRLRVLVPKAVSESGDVDAALRRLVREFRVSQEVALRRLASEGLVDQHAYAAKLHTLRVAAAAHRAAEKRRREERKKPVRIDVVRVKAAAVGRLALRALLHAMESGRLTEGDVAGVMEIRTKHLPELQRFARE
jgi:Zn-dependent peptidase ImmA (M78 family)/transcriptional regulator with XRE-family HTH domain